MVLILFWQLPSWPDILDYFFSYWPGLTRAILSDLHYVLYLPPKEDRTTEIKILHASLSDFLLDAKHSGRFFIDLAKSHMTIVKNILGILGKWGGWNYCCLVALLLRTPCQTFLESWKLPATLPFQWFVSRRIDVLKDIYELDLLQYVSRYYHHRHIVDVATFFKWMKLKVRFEVIP